MGEVWRARDSKLGREVAIKTLPDEFAQDEARLARFEREAKLLASLNHPNIAAIYGLEDDDGTRFLVLELVEGDTLAERLKHGAIPVEESLKLALQIAEALEAAHEKGVIHRDLKPLNIKVTPEGKIKVLDFGLAKAFLGDGADVNLSQSPTLSMAATQQGVILGTAAYMSPEQAAGGDVGRGSDIWAFGVVLFEMITGRRLFAGETAPHVLASVLKTEPDWNSLPPNLHPRLRLLLERCLEKEVKDRYHDISDARVDIQKVLADPSGVLVQPVADVFQAKPRPLLRWIAVTAVASVIVAGVAGWYLKPSELGPVIRFYHVLPEGRTFTGTGRPVIAVSPDGSEFLYNTNEGLYLRSMDELDARLVSEEDLRNPFFSPDGQWVGYWSNTDGQLKKIAVSGGAPVTLCDATNPFGVSWGIDDTIVFGQPEGIMRVSANGGTPEPLIETAEGELVFGPQILPDGESVLFTLRDILANPVGVTPGVGGSWDTALIIVESLDTGEREVLIEAGRDGRYVPTGHLVYVIEEVLYARPFDLDSLRVTGGPVPLLAGMSGTWVTGTANFDISDEGVLVQLAGGPRNQQSGLIWVDRQGTFTPIFEEERLYAWPRVSPDGSRIAVLVDETEGSNIWIYDIATGSRGQLTDDRVSKNNPIWTPDGERITFRYGPDIYWQRVDASEQAELLWESEYSATPRSWSRDGRFLVFEENHPETGRDIWVLSADDRSAEPFLNTPSQEVEPVFSPDGEWIAYSLGRSEVWVAPYPGPGIANQITGDGGTWPLWSTDGQTLYYRASQQIFSSAIDTEPDFRRSEPVSLFQLSIPFILSDVEPSGDRFVMVQTGDDFSQINVVLNWFEELKDKVPVP